MGNNQHADQKLKQKLNINLNCLTEKEEGSTGSVFHQSDFMQNQMLSIQCIFYFTDLVFSFNGFDVTSVEQWKLS